MVRNNWMIGNKNRLTHGMTKTATYSSWVAMISRCKYPTNDRYKNYGGRGISVCEEWKDFNNFLKDMGVRPKGKTLDRIDVNGNYNKENCRWSSSHTQYRNMAKNRTLELRGQKKILSDWAREFNTSTTALHYHLNKHGGLEHMYQWRLDHNKQVPKL